MEPFVVAPGATLQAAVGAALGSLPPDHGSTEALRTALLSMREAALALERAQELAGAAAEGVHEPGCAVDELCAAVDLAAVLVGELRTDLRRAADRATDPSGVDLSGCVTEAEDLEGEVRNAQALAGMLARALERGGRRPDRAPVLARELEFALHRAATLDVDDADELLGHHR